MSERYSKARFWKCALQVNPAGYIAYRGQDHGLSEDEYNRQLLAACKEQNIKVVGLAGHGNVDSVDAIRDLFSENGIIVFPGFEIASSEKAHFVCFFPENTTRNQLNRYLGNRSLSIAQGALSISPSPYPWLAPWATIKRVASRLSAECSLNYRTASVTGY